MNLLRLHSLGTQGEEYLAKPEIPSKKLPVYAFHATSVLPIS